MPNVSRLLRAAATIAGLTTVDVAFKTCIRESRIKNILSGRAIPEPKEFERIAAACGLDARALTSRYPYAIARKGKHRIVCSDVPSGPEAFAALVEYSTRFSSEVSVKTESRLLVDTVSVTFEVDDSTRFLRQLSSHGTAVELRDSPYAHHYRLGSLFVQHSLRGKSASASRVEFRADALTKHALVAAAGDLFCLARRSTVRLSRLDVAADLPVSINDVQALGSSRQKVAVYLGCRGVETLQLGRRASKLQIVVYDKRQERIDRAAAPPATCVTRFEARVRRPGIAIEQLAMLPNPFCKLRLLDLRRLDLPFERRVLVCYARLFGVPALRDHLDDETFKLLLSAVSRAERADDVPHPRQLFDERWRVLAGRLSAKLTALGFLP